MGSEVWISGVSRSYDRIGIIASQNYFQIISRSALSLRGIPVAFTCLHRYPSVSLGSHGSTELSKKAQFQHSPGTVWTGNHYSRLLDQCVAYWNKILLMNWNVTNIYKTPWTHKKSKAFSFPHLFRGNLYTSWLTHQISDSCELKPLSYECLRNRVHSRNDRCSTGML